MMKRFVFGFCQHGLSFVFVWFWQNLVSNELSSDCLDQRVGQKPSNEGPTWCVCSGLSFLLSNCCDFFFCGARGIVVHSYHAHHP